MNRRRYLAVVTGAVALVSGCTGDSPGDTASPVTGTRSPGTGGAVESPTGTATPTATAGGTQTATRTQTTGAATEVTVGANGAFRFAPSSFSIAAGETVRWVWETGGHNVVADAVPNGADWSGTPGGDAQTYDEGYVHEHTFEVAGTYEYYCSPHRSYGMTGSFTVE